LSDRSEARDVTHLQGPRQRGNTAHTRNRLQPAYSLGQERVTLKCPLYPYLSAFPSRCQRRSSLQSSSHHSTGDLGSCRRGWVTLQLLWASRSKDFRGDEIEWGRVPPR
jgi:hypothetical protein